MLPLRLGHRRRARRGGADPPRGRGRAAAARRLGTRRGGAAPRGARAAARAAVGGLRLPRARRAAAVCRPQGTRRGRAAVGVPAVPARRHAHAARRVAHPLALLPDRRRDAVPRRRGPGGRLRPRGLSAELALRGPRRAGRAAAALASRSAHELGGARAPRAARRPTPGRRVRSRGPGARGLRAARGSAPWLVARRRAIRRFRVVRARAAGSRVRRGRWASRGARRLGAGRASRTGKDPCSRQPARARGGVRARARAGRPRRRLGAPAAARRPLARGEGLRELDRAARRRRAHERPRPARRTLGAARRGGARGRRDASGPEQGKPEAGRAPRRPAAAAPRRSRRRSRAT